MTGQAHPAAELTWDKDQWLAHLMDWHGMLIGPVGKDARQLAAIHAAEHPRDSVTAYAVSRAWTTDLEPGTWYEIVPADRPQIIAGFVFAAPRPGTEVWDFRAVDGHRIPARDNSCDTAGWLAAVTAYRKDKENTA